MSVGGRLDKNALIQLVPQKNFWQKQNWKKWIIPTPWIGESLGKTAQIECFCVVLMIFLKNLSNNGTIQIFIYLHSNIVNYMMS